MTMDKQYTYRYPHPAVTTDCVVFGFDGVKLNVLLVERGNEPYKGAWAFPGGFLDIDEDAQKDYITLHGLDKPENLSVQQIREYNTGTNVYLAGRITPVNAMEDLKIEFVM